MPQAMLDCVRCGSRKYTNLVEEQVRRLQGIGSALIFCDRCRQETEWSYASHDRRSGSDRRPEKSPLTAEAVPAPPAVKAPPTGNPYQDLARSFLHDKRGTDRRGVQQRRHRRVPLELAMRVTAKRDGAKLQETTKTLNVSRAGVYFHSELGYQKDLPVNVELNYSDTAPAAGMEQPGTVVRVDPVPATPRRGVAVKLT